MAKAVEARWYGDDYQARFFWIMAARLRDSDHSYVVEVSYEADGPKAFDDVIVKYDPPHPGRGRPVVADYHQIKFHVTQGGRFGFKDLIDPQFIGATKVSILQRLVAAKKTAPINSAFTLVTTDRVSDSDALGDILSSNDGSIRLDKLFDKTTDRSRMGQVRKTWREHLNLDDDDELKKILEGFHIAQGHYSAEQLREQVNLRFRIAGLITSLDTIEFKFDGAARELKKADRNRLSRADFESFCVEQKWIRAEDSQVYASVAIRSFSDAPIDRLDAPPDRTLSLVDLFNGRLLQDGMTWEADVQPLVTDFLINLKQQLSHIRLFLDTHLSLAFLAGSLLGLKSGVAVELIQKGRAGTSTWKADDGLEGPDAVITTHTVSDGEDVAIVVNLSRNALADVQDYVAHKLPAVGRILDVVPPTGPGAAAIKGGSHASRIADQVADAVKDFRMKIGAATHVFIAAPNSFAFLLGQHGPAMGQCIVYEYDFSREVDAGYHPTFRIK